MSLRDILVCLDPTDSGEARLRLAADPALRPEFASVDMGSTNIDPYLRDERRFATTEATYVNRTSTLIYLTRRMRELGVRPVLTCWAIPFVRMLDPFFEMQLLDEPAYVLLVHTGEPVLGYVTDGRVKLANLRARPQTAVTFRRGWQWATVEGRAELGGPDDPQPWLDSDQALARLLRDIFTAAGGTHDDWDAYDRTMREQRRTAVLVTPTRVYTNG